MTEKFSEKREVPDPQTSLLLSHLDKLLQVRLATLPDSSFKTNRFIPLGINKFVSVYSRRYFPSLARLFDRVEISLVAKDVKRVVFTGSLPLENPAPLILLIDDLFTILGKDLFKKSAFNSRDMAGLKQGRWAGRRWQLAFDKRRHLPLLIDLMDSRLQLCVYLPA